MLLGRLGYWGLQAIRFPGRIVSHLLGTSRSDSTPELTKLKEESSKAQEEIVRSDSTPELTKLKEELSKAQEEVVCLRDELESIYKSLHGTSVALVTQDEKLVIRKIVNWLAPKITEAGAAIGKPCIEVYPILAFPDVVRLRENEEKALKTGQRQRIEFVGAIGSDHDPTTIDVIHTPVTDSRGQRTLRSVYIDVTELRHAQQTIQKLLQAQALRMEELEQAKLKAESASKAKSEFLANVSHEIRTPLHALLLSAELLAESGLRPQQLESLQTMQRSGTNLLALINDILDFAKAESGKLQLELLPTDLPLLLKDIYAQTGPLAVASGNKFEMALCQDLPVWVKVDCLRLRQVLINLLSNAHKFCKSAEVKLSANLLSPGEWDALSKNHSHAVVEENAKDQAEHSLHLFSPNFFPATESDKDWRLIRFSITDRGIGIAKSSFGRMFSEFGQADSTTTRRFGGSGLGLSICKGLVFLMRGHISVTSKEGSGSTFTVDIPLQTVDKPDLKTLSAIKVPSPRSPAERKLSLCDPTTVTASVDSDEPLIAEALVTPVTPPQEIKQMQVGLEGHVLVVDDSAVNRKVACHALKKLGYSADTAQDGQQCIEMIQAKPRAYLAVLLDLHMPVLDGFQATARVREWEASTKQSNKQLIVAMSAAPPTQGIGADMFLQKPVSLQQLSEALSFAKKSRLESQLNGDQSES